MVVDISSKSEKMRMEEFCGKWELAKNGKYCWRPGATKLYLKDWHLFKLFPSYSDAYITPEYFMDDWLNDWLCKADVKNSSNFACDSDYKFCYWGAAGTETKLHTDVLKSNSWSGNVTGTKRWRLLSSKYSSILEDLWGRCKYSSFDEIHAEKLPIQDFLQYQGEIVFVPSGWYHEVQNIEDTLSINHNWIDSESLMASWKYLKKEYELATSLIDDCKELTTKDEFEQLVQRNVLINCGMNYHTFYCMIKWNLLETEGKQQTTSWVTRRRQASCARVIMDEVSQCFTNP
eukprot:jgi/Picsp_1/455/NSC_00453-R1_jmjc domain-containing protein 4-like